MRIWRSIVAGTLVWITLAACGIYNPGGIDVERHEALSQQLEAIVEERRTVPLAELIPGDWDRARLYVRGDTWEMVEDEIGVSVDARGRFYSDVLVLFRGGEAVRVIALRVWRFTVPGEFSRDALLAGRRNYPLELYEPG